MVREALDVLKMPSVVKTTGSKGLHVYVPIGRGPEQKLVWTFAKALAMELASRGTTVNAVLPGNVATEGLAEPGDPYR